jgi:hypothetical protein
MSTVKGSAHYTGLLPVVRPINRENHRFADGWLSRRKRASSALSRLLVAFCMGVAATLAWWSYGGAASQMIANGYLGLGRLTPRAQPVAHNDSNMGALGAPASPLFDQQQLSVKLDAVQQSIDRLVAGQEQTMRSIDQIASSISAGQEQMTRSIDQIADSIAAGQEQMMRRSEQTATGIGQPPPAKGSGVTVASRDDAASLAPTAALPIKPTEAKPPEKQLSAVSGHDPSCFPSASAVLQNYPGGSPSWTLRAPGHQGTQCWHAAARPRASDRQREMMSTEQEIVGTAENWLSPPLVPYRRAPE